MQPIVIRGADVWHNGRYQKLQVRTEGSKIAVVAPNVDTAGARVIDADGLMLLPGVVDIQVHFRDPGATHKEDLASGSRAAARGGVTSFLEMPNTWPPATTQKAMDYKLELGAKKSRVNYGFFVGATNDNLEDLKGIQRVCGIKIFMGASTGDLLVDDPKALEAIFAETDKRRVIALHCEDEARIRANTERLKHRNDFRVHSEIRDVEAAYLATEIATGFARKYQHRTHILHLSSAREVDLLRRHDPIVTAETSPHHLLLNVRDYDELGARAKMNPSLKYEEDNRGLWKALHDGFIQCIATDHAPHLLTEKRGGVHQAPAGIPAVENSLSLILDAAHRGLCSYDDVARWMCEAPPKIYRMKRKGVIGFGMDADLTLVDPNEEHTVLDEEQLTHCKWSPWHGKTLTGRSTMTIVGGQVVFENGQVNDDVRGSAIEYDV